MILLICYSPDGLGVEPNNHIGSASYSIDFALSRYSPGDVEESVYFVAVVQVHDFGVLRHLSLLKCTINNVSEKYKPTSYLKSNTLNHLVKLNSNHDGELLK